MRQLCCYLLPQQQCLLHPLSLFSRAALAALVVYWGWSDRQAASKRKRDAASLAASIEAEQSKAAKIAGLAPPSKSISSMGIVAHAGYSAM